MYGRALAAVDRVFALGMQPAFPISAELIFRRLKNVSYSDIVAMNARVGGGTEGGGGGLPGLVPPGPALLPSAAAATDAKVTATTGAAALTYPMPTERRAEERRARRRLVLLSNSPLMEKAAALNMYDIQLYRYGERHKCIEI
jgi:hypothetical protein